MPIEINNDSGANFYGDGNSDYLKEEGVYHFLCTHATDMPLDKNGGQIVNGMLQIQLTVAAGPQKDKTFEQTFFHLKPDASDKQRAMQTRQLMRLAYACNLVGNAEVIAGKLSFEPSLMEAHQLIVKVSSNTNEKTGKSYLQIHFSDIWHIDDPDAPKECAIDAATVGELPTECRRKPEYFAALKDALKGAASSTAGSQGEKKAANSLAANGSNGGANSTQAKKPVRSLADL